jgi:uncharacterized membrane protein YdcZ (DUF606 family)
MSDAPQDALTRKNLCRRLIFLGCAVVLLAAAVLVGIADNPPGLLLAFASSILAVLALTTGWQHPRKHFYLFVGSFLAFALTAVLHNVFEAAASVAGVPWLKSAGGFIGAAFFLVAIFLCPAGIVVGAVGGIASMLRRKRPAGA